jgi:hypothetical protein
MPSTSYVNVIFFPSADAEESSLPSSHVNFHFLNKDDLFDDEAGVEGFYIF